MVYMYTVHERTSNPKLARKYFKNRRIKGAVITKIEKSSYGSKVTFTKSKKKAKSRSQFGISGIPRLPF